MVVSWDSNQVEHGAAMASPALRFLQLVLNTTAAGAILWMPLPAGACRLVARTSRLIGKKEEAALRLAGGQLASLRSLPLASLAQGHSVVRCQVEVLRLMRDQNVAELQLEVVQHNR